MGDGGDTETVTHDDDGTRADTLTILSLNRGVQPQFGKCGFSVGFPRNLGFEWKIKQSSEIYTHSQIIMSCLCGTNYKSLVLLLSMSQRKPY